jgi:hypothetical protein
MPNPNINRRIVRSASGYDPNFPDTLSGLVNWWKADSLVLNDGDPVSTWNDSKGTNNLTGVTTARPLYKANIFGTKPVVRFDGTDDLMTFASTLTFNRASKFTAFVVIAPDHPVTAGILFGQNSGGSNYWAAFGGVPLAFTLRNAAAQNFSSDNLSTANGSAMMAVYRYDTTVQFRENTTDRSDSLGASSDDFSFTLLGRFAVASALWLKADVAEIAVYTGAKTIAECDSFYNNYARLKYTNLPIA